jgi:hypothetical protein
MGREIGRSPDGAHARKRNDLLALPNADRNPIVREEVRMSEAASSRAPAAQNRTALASLGLGLLAVVSFLLGDVSGGVLFLVGAVSGAGALVSGIVGWRRARAGGPWRRAAIAGTLLGLLILAWFGIFGLLAAFGVING